MAQVPKGDSGKPVHFFAGFDYQDKELIAFLRRQEKVLALLRKAAEKPGCSFDHDYFQSADPSPLELNQFRAAAGLLALDARSKARHGDRRALEDVTALFGMARHVREPMLIPFLASCT